MGACEEVVYLPNCHVGRDHWMMITFLSFGCCFSVKKNLQTKAIYHCYTMAARSICCRMMLPSASWNLSIAGNTPRPPRTQSEISGTTWNHPIFWKKKHRFHRDFPNEWTTQWIKTRFFRVPFLENPGQHRASSNLWPQSRSLAGEKKLAIHHSSIIHQSFINHSSIITYKVGKISQCSGTSRLGPERDQPSEGTATAQPSVGINPLLITALDDRTFH